LGFVLVPVAVTIGEWTACNTAMKAGDADVIGSSLGGGRVARVIAAFLLFMIGSSRRP
jgi:hypothetical protein